MTRQKREQIKVRKLDDEIREDNMKRKSKKIKADPFVNSPGERRDQTQHVLIYSHTKLLPVILNGNPLQIRT